MNILLWVLQILLAFHTVTGAIWKFSHSAAETMPSLGAIPQPAWLALAAFEILCAIALILPVFKKFRGKKLAPLGAIGIGAEMLMFCGLHLASGDTNLQPMIYWLIVAVICALIAVGRARLKPL